MSRPEPRYVERTNICMNCGAPVEMGDEGIWLWLHTDGYRQCSWLRMGVITDGTATYAAPTDWFDAREDVGYRVARLPSAWRL